MSERFPLRILVANDNLVNQPKIIALTANAMQDDSEACLKAGVDDYISKPIELDKLVAILKQVPTVLGCVPLHGCS